MGSGQSLVYVIWKDTKVVTVALTMHTATGIEKVIRKMKDKAGQLLCKEVKIPPTVEYNKYMGGIDLSDQAISYYNILRKTRKYWRTLFFLLFLDVMVTNSYLLYKLHLPEEERKKCTQRISGEFGNLVM